MPRRSSRPSGGRRAAPAPRARPPARAASSRAASPPRRAAAAAPPPAPAQKQTATPPAPAPAQSGSAMGGFMANVASTGLGVMAGRAMDRALFGGSGGAAQAAPEEIAPEDQVPAYNNDYALNGEEITPSVCAREALEFKKCMERTASDVQACQWNLDILAACQQQQKQTGFADAGRL